MIDFKNLIKLKNIIVLGLVSLIIFVLLGMPLFVSEMITMEEEQERIVQSENISTVASKDYAANAFIYEAKQRRWTKNATIGVLAYMLAEGIGPMGTFTYESYWCVEGPSGQTMDLTLDNRAWLDWMESSGKYQMRSTSYAYRTDIYCAFGIGLLQDSDVWSTSTSKTVSNATNLIKFANKKGRPWQDPETQMGYFFDISFKQPTAFDTKGVDPTKDKRTIEEWCRRITCGYGMPAWNWQDNNRYIDSHLAKIGEAKEYFKKFDKDFKYINVTGGALAEDPDFMGHKNAWTSDNPFYPTCSGQCTWFAWGRFYEIYGYDAGFRGNGSSCAEAVVNTHPDKFELSNKPKAGAVFSTKTGTYGHVGIVIDVQGNMIVVQEGNYGPQNWNYPTFIKHGHGTCKTNSGWRTSMYSVNTLNAIYANPK